MSTANVDISLSTIAGKSWSDLQLLNPETIRSIERLSSQFYGGTVASMELLLYLILAVVFGMTFTLNAETYQDLSSITTCNISNMGNIVTYISYVGILICAVRIVFGKVFIDISSQASAIWELVLGIILWLLFLVQMVLSITMNSTLNDTTKCNSSNADQAKIIANAKSGASKEQTLATAGFILTTLYTIANGTRLYMVKSAIIPTNREHQAEILRKNIFPEQLLNPNAQILQAAIRAEPNADVVELGNDSRVRA
jgi:hypothetical protein